MRERLQACLVLKLGTNAVSCSPGRIVKTHDLYMCDLIYLSSIKINIKNAVNLLLDSTDAVSGSKTTREGTSIILFDVKFCRVSCYYFVLHSRKVRSQLGGGLM